MRTIGFLISALKALVTGGGVSLASLGKGKLLAHGDRGVDFLLQFLSFLCLAGEVKVGLLPECEALKFRLINFSIGAEVVLVGADWGC